MMNVLVILMLISISTEKLISNDKVVDLLKKFVRNQLTKKEARSFNYAIDILEMNQPLSETTSYNTPLSRMGLYCFLCRAVATVLFDAVHEDFTEKQLTTVLTKICMILRVARYNVCKGVSELNVPVLAYIIKNTPEAKPNTFCGLAFQNDYVPDFCGYEDPRFEWEVDLPDFDEPAQLPSTTARPLKVALITDVHLDPLYEPNGVANCGEPTCSRKGQTIDQAIQYRFNESIYDHSFYIKKGEIFLDLKVAPKMRKMKRANRFTADEEVVHAGYWGDYRSSDTPLWTFDEVVASISSEHKSVNVVYYIGDTVDHHLWATTYDQNKRMNHYIIDKLRKSLGDKVLIVPVVGNHESHPINQFAPPSIKEENVNTTWLYKSLATEWRLPKDARATFRKRGVYSVLVRPGLRAIVLNTNVAYRYNWWVVYDPLEPKSHLEWLVNELHKAERAGEKVHILSHIPAGVADLIHTWTREYNKITNRFASTIAAEFNGHTHADEFKIFYNSEGEPSRVAWNAGGVTTNANFNPNYKIIKFHPNTHEPINIESYIFNLTKANRTPDRKPHWFRIYDLKRKFRLSDLSPASMHDLVTRMAKDNNLLDLYVDNYYKMSDSRPPCDANCKLLYLCSTVVTVLWDREKCDQLGRGTSVVSDDPL